MAWTSSIYDHFDLYLTPVSLTFNLPEKMFQMALLLLKGNNCAKLFLKSMHKCTSYGRDMLNICSMHCYAPNFKEVEGANWFGPVHLSIHLPLPPPPLTPPPHPPKKIALLCPKKLKGQIGLGLFLCPSIYPSLLSPPPLSGGQMNKWS